MRELIGEIRAVPLDLEGGLAHYPDLVEALDYWRDKCRSRIAPARRDIDPLDMRDILPRILLADVTTDDAGALDFRYRLSGTGICDVHGYELTQLSPRELQPATYGALIDSHYREAVRTRRPSAHIILLNTDQMTRSYARLLLPLSEDGEAVTMLMAVDSEAQNALHDFLEVIDALGSR